jgi:hypothetical protein
MRVALEGRSPLLMHNGQLADPLNPFVKSIGVLTSKARKTDDDLWQIRRLEFEGGLYFDPAIGPFVPAENVESMLQTAAKQSRHGAAVQRGVIVQDNEVPLLYEGPRTVDAMWEDFDAYALVKRVVVNRGSSTMRCRPCFRSWAVEFDVLVDETQINPADFTEVVKRAGNYFGLCDYRPRYGRYEATVEAA